MHLRVRQSSGEQSGASQSLHIASVSCKSGSNSSSLSHSALQPEYSNGGLTDFGIGILDERREEFERSARLDGQRDRTQSQAGERRAQRTRDELPAGIAVPTGRLLEQPLLPGRAHLLVTPASTAPSSGIES